MSDESYWDDIDPYNLDLPTLRDRFLELRSQHRNCLPQEHPIYIALYALPFALVATTVVISATHPTVATVVVAVLSALVATWGLYHRFRKFFYHDGEVLAIAVALAGTIVGVGLGSLLASPVFQMRV